MPRLPTAASSHRSADVSWETPSALVASTLLSFLHHSRIARVHLAGNSHTPPQPLSYLVHFPRLSVTLAGIDSMWMEQGERARLVNLPRGEAVVVPANCWNRPLWTHPCTTLNVLFGRKQIGLSLVKYEGQGPVPPEAIKVALDGARDETTRSIMQALLTLQPHASDAATSLVDALLRAIVETLQTPSFPPRRRATGLYESICMYVQEHFQFPLNRDAVAARFGVSPNHVSRLFRREGMVTFNGYVNYVRISRAKYLLKKHRQTLDEVAVNCGYSDTSYFCRVFKKTTKVTPSVYRQECTLSTAPSDD